MPDELPRPGNGIPGIGKGDAVKAASISCDAWGCCLAIGGAGPSAMIGPK